MTAASLHPVWMLESVRMETETLELITYLAILGALPYAALEGYEFLQRLAAKRRGLTRE